MPEPLEDATGCLGTLIRLTDLMPRAGSRWTQSADQWRRALLWRLLHHWRAIRGVVNLSRQGALATVSLGRRLNGFMICLTQLGASGPLPQQPDPYAEESSTPNKVTVKHRGAVTRQALATAHYWRRVAGGESWAFMRDPVCGQRAIGYRRPCSTGWHLPLSAPTARIYFPGQARWV